MNNSDSLTSSPLKWNSRAKLGDATYLWKTLGKVGSLFLEIMDCLKGHFFIALLCSWVCIYFLTIYLVIIPLRKLNRCCYFLHSMQKCCDPPRWQSSPPLPLWKTPDWGWRGEDPLFPPFYFVGHFHMASFRDSARKGISQTQIWTQLCRCRKCTHIICLGTTIQLAQTLHAYACVSYSSYEYEK